MPLSDALRETADQCGCKCDPKEVCAGVIDVRVGSVTCRACGVQICQACCVAVAVAGSDMPEFRCHSANEECPG